MKAASIAKNIKQVAVEPVEVVTEQAIKPLAAEAAHQIAGLWEGIPGFGSKPQVLAQEDLQRARNQVEIEAEGQKSDHAAEIEAEKILMRIKEEYHLKGASRGDAEQAELDKQFVELREQIAKLAEASGIETKAHLETPPEKVSALDIKRLQSIVGELTEKVEEAKTAEEMGAQQTNAKRSTGMLAWVSGKQMKIHEQGTLQLQG